MTQIIGYRMLYRPVSSVTLPDGVTWSWLAKPSSRERYGIFATAEPLTDEQCSRFDIEQLSDFDLND